MAPDPWTRHSCGYDYSNEAHYQTQIRKFTLRQ